MFELLLTSLWVPNMTRHIMPTTIKQVLTIKINSQNKILFNDYYTSLGSREMKSRWNCGSISCNI